MTRHGNGPSGKAIDPAAAAEAAYQEQLKAGEVIQMIHEGKGVRYITNTERAIREARLRGYEDVQYEEEVVTLAVPKAKAGATTGLETEGK